MDLAAKGLVSLLRNAGGGGTGEADGKGSLLCGTELQALGKRRKEVFLVDARGGGGGVESEGLGKDRDEVGLGRGLDELTREEDKLLLLLLGVGRLLLRGPVQDVGAFDQALEEVAVGVFAVQLE